MVFISMRDIYSDHSDFYHHFKGYCESFSSQIKKNKTFLIRIIYEHFIYSICSVYLFNLFNILSQNKQHGEQLYSITIIQLNHLIAFSIALELSFF